MVRVAIAGGAGYTAGELLRLLVNHPEVEVKFIQSESHDGQPVGSVHTDLAYLPLRFSAIDFGQTDILFMCAGHGQSAAFLAANRIPDEVRIIDLGNDFRLKASAGDFVYGLPELSFQKIAASRHIANPGCFATSIELATLPLAAAGLLPGQIDVVGITGSTGAGQKPSEETHFSLRSGNLSNYKVFTHQHLDEIKETLVAGGASPLTDMAFVPVRGCHTRGILSNVILRTKCSEDEIRELYKNYYAAAPFVYVADTQVHMKQVVNTNFCFISIAKHDDKLLLTAVIDNLLKGASGQAVQNMNIMLGIDQTTGLHLKAANF